jgi:two-component system, response regulator PdtaR
MEYSLSTVAPRAGSAKSGRTTSDGAVVLIVENEVLIRLNAVQMIEDAGYITLEAEDADKAIAILKRRQDIGAVFTDVYMSGSKSGLRLARAVRRRWPPIHLIVTSGLPTDGELPPGSHFIRKPYENACVVALLHELFDGT